MAQAVEDREPQVRLEGRQANKPGRGPIDWLGGWRACSWGASPSSLLAVAIRIFQQFTAWTVGHRRRQPGLRPDYRSLFIAEVLAATVGTLVWWGYLVAQGSQGRAQARPTHPTRRSAGSWCSGA